VDTPATEPVSDEVERQVWSCPEGADVEFYIVDGGGHTWPGTPLPEPLATILGYTTTDIDATAIAWEWFKSHPMSNT
jgi:polyhydroxybutyrate depolymerase